MVEWLRRIAGSIRRLPMPPRETRPGGDKVSSLFGGIVQRSGDLAGGTKGDAMPPGVQEDDDVTWRLPPPTPSDRA